MGTPEFAVPSLQVLVEAGMNVVAVITAPDKPKGRGRQLAPSPVKEYAASQNLAVLQPTNLKNPAFIEELRGYQADLQVVVAFRMLPEVVWNMPPQGTFNLHASLLPQYRGAAPINWAIINGETETGATTFFLKHAIDTGDLIFQEPEPIHPTDNAGTLYERLMHKGAALVLKTVQAISNGTVTTQPQPTITVEKAAPKIHKETCQINWQQSAEQVHNFVRGLAPYPAAWTELNGKTFKILGTALLPDKTQAAAAGSIDTDQKTFLHVSCGQGWLAITQLQPQGKKAMPVDAYFRGNQI